MGQLVGRPKTPKINLTKKLQKTEGTHRNYIVSVGQCLSLTKKMHRRTCCSATVSRFLERLSQKTAIKFSCLNYSIIPCLCKEKLKADRSTANCILKMDSRTSHVRLFSYVDRFRSHQKATGHQPVDRWVVTRLSCVHKK